jgi:indole-3-glycerol phosphate synthase
MILDRILKDKKDELENAKRRIPLDKIRGLALEQSEPIDLESRLVGERVQLITEVKKASPSKGIICQDFDPIKIATTYAANRAAAISVLTETNYFLGSLNYLLNIKNSLGSNRPPLIRKDFIFETYQIYESRVFGADALLLILAILNPDQLEEFLILSHSLNMKCLVEVHNENELETVLKSRSKIIGINNRDLKTFKVDLNTTARLSRFIPKERLIVSESGIKNRSDMENLKSWGVQAALVGESLISSNDIAAKMRELL